ncbi:MAG: prolyl oligopeptidase family serine peptidase [Planctomycetes bacterium]|nr:prolyl oligopeptidase family serine peptidase [Planctomycetota bacterium]
MNQRLARCSTLCLALLMTPTFATQPHDATDDPHLWLEDVTGEQQLAWVRERNAESTQALTSGTAFPGLERRILSILDSKERIPAVTKIGDHYYNLWRDAANPKGLWRRTTLDEYRKAAPAWETVIDVDALAKAEQENWVWHGATVLEPEDRQCLVSLSRGGADADVVREFDLDTKAFVNGGFSLPEAKSRVAWRGRDGLFVATDFGPGSLTTSGYPRTVREWTRGTPLHDAAVVFEGRSDDMGVGAYRDLTPGFERDFISRQITFWTNEFFLRREGKLVPVDKPADANASVHREWLLIELRSPWTVDGTTYPAGALLAADFEAFLAGSRTMHVLFAPTDRTSLVAWVGTRNHVLLTTLDNVRSRVEVLTFAEGAWRREPLAGVPEFGTASVTPVDEIESDEYWLVTSSPLEPSTLTIGSAATPAKAPEKLKQTPAFFDASGMKVEQHEAVSQDGTRIPYFQIGRADLPADGSTPTLLYGYGGFEIPLVPGYNPVSGVAWLERGHVYVIANIRGGGEFGPRWHQAALKEKRHRAYEDFAAVAEDLIARKVTSPDHLGIMGGSNGGLLMGNMLTMRPDLFGAIVCQVPLLDMRRFNKLLAGASWMGEYGDPDKPDEWAFLRGFSPYHTVAPEREYPPILITTSTRDDRVHPGHARKMTARLMEFGKPVLYYENIEGGHGGAADNKQKAFMDALGWTFLDRELTN